MNHAATRFLPLRGQTKLARRVRNRALHRDHIDGCKKTQKSFAESQQPRNGNLELLRHLIGKLGDGSVKPFGFSNVIRLPIHLDQQGRLQTTFCLDPYRINASMSKPIRHRDRIHST